MRMSLLSFLILYRIHGCANVPSQYWIRHVAVVFQMMRAYLLESITHSCF